MARQCDICGRKATTGNKVSHSNIKTKRKFNINLQNKTVNGKKKKLCARCIRALKKDK